MTNKIKIVFLGTSDAVPSKERNHTSIFMTYKNENILIDCGEGTQRQFRIAGLNPCKINKILITHWHGDHILGLPGLLQTLAFSGYNKELLIYGPRGTSIFMKNLLKTFIFFGKISIKVIELNKKKKFFETEDFFLKVEKMTHGVECNAYSFVKKEQMRIDKNKLKKSKLPSGPLLQKLKQGKDISHKGKKYFVKDLTFIENSKKISFVLDTNLNSRIIPFVKDSDLIVCESTFSSEEEKRAKEYHHLTSGQAGKIAKDSNSKKLILTHISQRYTKNQEKMLKEAKKIFKNSFLAKDLMSVEI